MFEDPTANREITIGDSLLKGYTTGSEIASRRQQLDQHQETLKLEQQKLQQQQAIMQIGQQAAETGDPRAIAMYSALNPEGGKSVRETADFFHQQGTADLQSIRESKITDRPAIYKMKIENLKKNNPYFDASQYPDEYDPDKVNPLLDADITAGRDRSKAYQLQATDSGFVRFDPSTGQTMETGIKNPLSEQKLKLDNLKTQKEITKLDKEIANNGVDPEQRFKNTTALRQDYLNNSKTFQGVKEGYERVSASSEDPSAAGDLSLIFGYMKTLDPNSTVREGEFANAQNAGSAFSRIGATYNKVLNGERLTEKQREDFIDRSKKLYKQAEKSQRKTVDQYTKIAQRNDLDPRDVTVDFETTVPEQKGGQTPIPHPQKDAAIELLKQRGAI